MRPCLVGELRLLCGAGAGNGVGRKSNGRRGGGGGGGEGQRFGAGNVSEPRRGCILVNGRL